MIFQKTIKFISSWWLFALLLIFLCAQYIYFTSGEKTFEKWVDFVFHTPFGLVLYVGLIVNLTSASIRILITRLRNRKITPESIKNMDTYIEIPLSDRISSETIIGWMNTRGATGVDKDNSLNSLKGRFSFLPGYILRAGLIISMTALLFSVYLRKSEEKVFHTDEEGLLLNKRIYLTDIKSEMPDEFLQIGEKGTFRLDNASAVLSLSSKTYRVTGRFPVRIDGLYYRVTHLGFYQPLTVKTPKEEFLKNVDLDILPPGKTDIVALPSEDLLLTFTLHPEKTIKKGLTTGKVFNLKAPSYSVVLQKSKDKDKSENITIKPSETASLEGVDISLDKNSLFVKMQSVYDPALLWIYTGILITLAGIILMLSRFFWYEKQICAVFTNNSVLIGYREEFYKKWGILKFHKWREDLFPP